MGQTSEQYEAFMKAYNDAHAHCPKCKSDKYRTTLVGYMVNWRHPEKYRDGNKCECISCGWKGIRHDMV